MPDDKSKRGKQDRARINVNEDYERTDWAKKLGVSPDQLKSLVKKHGASVSAIKKALGKRSSEEQCPSRARLRDENSLNF